MTRSEVEKYLEQALLDPEATNDARKQSGRELYIAKYTESITISAYNSHFTDGPETVYERITDDGHRIYMTVEEEVDTGVDWIPTPLWNWLYDGRRRDK